MDYVGPALGALLFLAVISLVAEPTRHTLNTIILAGASGVYLSGGFGLWELAYPVIGTAIAFRALRSSSDYSLPRPRAASGFPLSSTCTVFTGPMPVSRMIAGSFSSRARAVPVHGVGDVGRKRAGVKRIRRPFVVDVARTHPPRARHDVDPARLIVEVWP